MIYKVNQHELVLELANELKKHIEMPDWARFVKTGVHRETVPRNPDWWYIRSASILRITHKLGPIGVSKLRTRYGGRKNRGVKPDKFALASGKVIRTILQQLEKAELIKQDSKGTHKGRITTPKGSSLIATTAKQIASKETSKNKEVKISKKQQKESKQEEPIEKKTESKEVAGGSKNE